MRFSSVGKWQMGSPAPKGSSEYPSRDILSCGVLIISRTYFFRCRFSHDIPGYLVAKPRDIYFPPSSALSSTPPFVSQPELVVSLEGAPPSIDPNTTCPVFAENGFCRQGFKCRFLGGHVVLASPVTADGSTQTGDVPSAANGGMALVVDEEKRKLMEEKTREGNIMPMNRVKDIRSRKVNCFLHPQAFLVFMPTP